MPSGSEAANGDGQVVRTFKVAAGIKPCPSEEITKDVGMKTLAKVKLDKIENDLDRLRRNPKDGPMLARFGYDHGCGLIYGSDGSCDLLFDNEKELNRDAARLLLHCAPETIAELVRGYRLAKTAGLVDGADTNITDELTRMFGTMAQSRIDKIAGIAKAMAIRDKRSDANKETSVRMDGVDEILSKYTKMINSTPMLLSLLYDIDMLPEQTVTRAGAIRLAGLCEVWAMYEKEKAKTNG